MINNSITPTSSYLLNSLNNFNLMQFKKNTKVIKFVLFSELLYLLIQQSRNYNKLYHQLVLQIEIIKKKLFLNIKERIILFTNHKNMKILMLKLKLHNIDYDNFIKNIFFAKKDAIYFLHKFIKKYKVFKGDQNFIHFVKVLQNEVINNNIYLKYIYLKKLNLYLKHFTVKKIKDLNNFFFPIIFNLLKKETHRIKLKSMIKKLISSYLFKGLNLELSRQKLQAVLLKSFKISTKYDIRILPYVEEIHLKEKKPLKKKNDIAMSIKNVFNFILKQNYNSNYFKLLKMLKKNKLDNIPFHLLFNVLNNIKLNTIYGFFNYNGLDYNFINYFKYNLKDYKNNNIDIFNIYKNNSLYISNTNIYSLMNKHFLNTYTIFNFFNSFLKRKKNNFFLSNLEKQIEYITYSYNKYNYYDFLLLQIKKNEINLNEFKDYIIIKKILLYIKKYKNILTSKNKIKEYFVNFYKIKTLTNKKNNNMIFNKNILVYFFKNLLNIYNKKSNKFDYYKKGSYIVNNKKKSYLYDALVIKEIISYLYNYKNISIKILYKKIREFKNYIIELIKNINNNYLNLVEYDNVKINKININDIYKINNSFNFSSDLNKYFLYNKFNNIYKKYFNKLKKIVIKYIFNKNINLNINTIYNTNNNKKNNYLLNNFYNKIINKIEEYKKIKISNNLLKFNKKLFSNKIYNFNIENLNLNFENYNEYLVNNNKLLFSSIFNNSLLINKYQINKEIINFNKFNIISNYKQYINLFKNNLLITNNKNNLFKEISLNNNLNLFLNKKLNFYNKLIKLSKKNLIFIKKNNYLFINKIDNNIMLENKKLDLLELLKINIFFNQQDINKILSKTVNYTTTELKKITKYQMKKKKSKRIY
jgi:hypothetical protein